MGLQLPPKGAQPQVFGSCLLLPNGCMDEHTAWYGSRPRPRPHCIRRGPSSPRKGHSTPPPLFWPMSIVATVPHLNYCWALVRLQVELTMPNSISHHITRHYKHYVVLLFPTSIMLKIGFHLTSQMWWHYWLRIKYCDCIELFQIHADPAACR